MKTIKIIIALTSTLIISTLTAQDLQPLKVKEYGIGLSSFNSFSLQYRWGNENRLFRLSGSIGGFTSFGKSSNINGTTADTNFTNSTSSGTTKTPISFNSGISFSMLKLKSINEKFGILYGGVLGITYNRFQTKTNSNGTSAYNYYNIHNPNPYPNSNQTENNSETFQPYLGIVIGAFYKINPSFILYAEITPNIYYAYNVTTIQSNGQGYQVTSNNPSNQIRTSSQTNYNNSFGLASLSNSGASLTIVYRLTK